MNPDNYLGKLGKDKITNFEGIIVAHITHLFGCATLGLAPQKTKDDGNLLSTQYFDIGRVEIIGSGITPEEVAAPDGKTGCDGREVPVTVR